MKGNRMLIIGFALLGISAAVAGQAGADPSEAAVPGSVARVLPVVSPVEDHPKSQPEHQSGKHEPRKHKHGRELGGVAQYETYLKQLVDKYAPETAKDWEPVLRDATRLRAELRQAMHDMPPDVRQQWHEQHAAKKDPQWQAKRAKAAQTRSAFDAALQSGDRVQISASLREMLQLCRQQNEWMSARLQELKQTGASH